MPPNADAGLFIPRPEYQVFPLKLPPLSRKDREQAVLNKLRGLYPEKLEDKYIVVLSNGKRGAYLAFVFPNSLQDDPLSIPTLAAMKLCKYGRQNCVIVYGEWVEYLILEEGKILSSMVTAGEDQLSDQMVVRAVQWFGLNKDQTDSAELIDTYPAEKEPDPVIKVFYSDPYVPAEASVKTGGFLFLYIPLEKALSPFPRSAWSCFPERLHQVKRRRGLITGIVCAASVVLIFFIQDLYRKNEAENAARKEAERLIVLNAAERKAREGQLAELTAAWEKQQAEQHVGVYAAVETLAVCLSPAIRLVSASIKEDGSFRLEGNAANAISALENLQNHPEVRDAVIGTIVWDRGQQRFTVNGMVERPPLLPEEGLDLEKKIAWYETRFVHSKQNKIMQDTAAAAAQKVWDLLERHRLKITRFRYLNASNGWTIESSLIGTGIQMVQVLKEADADDSLRVMSIETRNQNNNRIDAVLTFFVRGPGENRQQRWYAEHPSLAEIAALYGVLPVRTPFQGQVRQDTETGLPAIPPPIRGNSPLEYVGFIGIIDGKRYIYVKDSRTGDLYRLAEGTGNYSYKVDETGVITASFAGSSGPVEVKRNDGF